MKITVVGTGYVGLSLAVLLAQKNEVCALDINSQRVALINNRKSPIEDKDISKYLRNKKLNLSATTDPLLAYNNAEFVIIATPTNYDVENNKFDTSSIESVIETLININQAATIIIKSTVPVGYTKAISKKYKLKNIIFSPEFLREGKALHDNLHPSRIVVGEKSKRARIFADLLKSGAIKKNIPEIFTGSTEAEAIKLFANTYLAMRVAYFNELDNYAYTHNLSSLQIIEGVSNDPRIGDHYNNPSFGYGGYCLPKDTKQLLADFEGTPQSLIGAVIQSNDLRKKFIASSILKKKPKIVGVYRLVMKSGSDNFRESSIIEVMHLLNSKGVKIIIFEPSLKDDKFMEYENIRNFDEFIKLPDLIIANRHDKKMQNLKTEVFSRDVFGKD